MIFRQEKQKRKERIQIIMTTVAAGRSKTYDLVYIAVFAVVMAVCSWISIPAQVPFTLQTFGVFMAVGVLGGKRGTLAVLVYVLLGAVGVPVFAGFSGGIGALLGNAGGYIIGFIVAFCFIRCPYCRGALDWRGFSPDYCQHCGKKI